MAKQTKKIVKKTTAKPVPVMEHTCGKDCPCGCHSHSATHRLKHVMILIIVFILGYACGKVMCFKPGIKFGPAHGFHPVFTNGCLDMQHIKCEKMQQKMLQADVNGDGCVSIEEYKAQKPDFMKKHNKKPGMFNHMHGAKMAHHQ